MIFHTSYGNNAFLYIEVMLYLIRYNDWYHVKILLEKFVKRVRVMHILINANLG
ncbi:hypothetical protein EHF_0321 [Ehrlichia japonica]|uniref:Uncharacterized protein n=1 Tax=Ehrlichia japonica TaxID=391036 RepID=X5GKF4_9RICK|nr:hypothetical protein EHF_0321 [Ehrlichia japonica]